MAVVEKNGLMRYKDESGNMTNMYPITKKENVDGLEDFARGFTTAGDGSAYTVAVDGITSLEVGISFVLIPHTNSTTTGPTLNVNGLGAKGLRQRLSTGTATAATGTNANWVVSNKPVWVTYNGTYWVAEVTRPDANTIYGTTKVANGGTGASTFTAGSYLVGNGTDALQTKTPAEVLADIGAMSADDVANAGYATMTEVNAAISAAITGAIEGSY